jgi:hypothetical protein
MSGKMDGTVKLFHEIYNRYMLVIIEMLQKSQSPEGLTRSEMSRIIAGKGFFYDNIQFEDAITGQSKRSERNREVMDNVHLFTQRDGVYVTPFAEAGKRILPTILEKRWLKTVLADERARLFVSPALLAELDRWLKEVLPLYDIADVLLKNCRTNGDPYQDAAYIERFRTILSAVQQRSQVRILNVTFDGRRVESRFTPYRLEYSLKDDVFRVCGGVADEAGDDGVKLISMRLSRIEEVEPLELLDSGAEASGDRFLELAERRRSQEKVLLEIANSRNGFERFLHFFSNYSRMARYQERTGKLIVELDYYDFDESELIISILAMGPIVKVIGPERLRMKVIERLHRQVERQIDITK